MPLELMTIKQVAVFLKSSPSHVYDLVRQRRIPHIRIPGSKRIYFDRTRLDEYLKACEVEAEPLRGVWVEPELQIENPRPRKRGKYF